MKLNALRATLLSGLVVLTGCAKKPQLVFHKEDLTGIPCCKIKHNQLQSTHDKISAEFTLKNCSSSKELIKNDSGIQGILTITYQGEKRDYFNSTVSAELEIDGVFYPVKIIHTLNKPMTLFDRHYIPLPRGGGTYFSTSRDLTIKTLMMNLSYESLSILSCAQKSSIEIKISTRQPISFKFTPENIQVLKEFKNKCIDQQPTKKDLK
ncbi:MAG TPA: hypothetical protein DD412_01905 [Holosporales bacterium]|nr:hypothetical protein [Holosporales bacterium]